MTAAFKIANALAGQGSSSLTLTQTVTPPPYLRGTGVTGSGPNEGGAPDYSRTGVNGETFDTFGCQVFNYDPGPPTPDWQTTPNPVYFERDVFTNGVMTMPDGFQLEYWGFEDTLRRKGARVLPSPVIRLKEGQLAHVKLKTSKGPHTIHHHGIEPTTMNDGVGHVSFETSGDYTYQFLARHAGTWFYHCHRNTVLHFKMGLYGLLIVDPPEAFPQNKPIGVPYRGGSKHSYDVEAFWVADDRDPIWQGRNHAAGLCGEDEGFNIWKPKYFFLTGVHKNFTQTSTAVRVRASRGLKQRVLIRLLNGAYSMLKVKINGIPVECISMDGHAMDPATRPWCRPYGYAAGEAFLLPTAQRMELWFSAANLAPGLYPVDFEYLDWVTGKPHNHGAAMHRGTARTFIEITA